MLQETTSLGRVTGAVARAQAHWQARHQQAELEGVPLHRALGFTIALSREAGTPDAEVAHELDRRLGWPVYDHEILERIAQEMGLRVSLVESVDERRLNWLMECVEAIASMPHLSEFAYVRHLIQTMLSLAAHGECIIVGRGATALLPPETTLRVRLVGAPKDRVAALSRQRGISESQAERRLEEIDRERAAFIKQHFHQDPGIAHHYDLIVNTSRWSVAECADLIVDALQRLQKRTAGQHNTPTA